MGAPHGVATMQAWTIAPIGNGSPVRTLTRCGFSYSCSWPRTPSVVGRRRQLTDALGLRRDQLSIVAYHVRELHKVGLLRPHGTRQVRGAMEHFYKLDP